MLAEHLTNLIDHKMVKIKFTSKIYENKKIETKNAYLKNCKQIVPIRLDVYVSSQILDPKFFWIS